MPKQLWLMNPCKNTEKRWEKLLKPGYRRKTCQAAVVNRRWPPERVGTNRPKSRASGTGLPKSGAAEIPGSVTAVVAGHLVAKGILLL